LRILRTEGLLEFRRGRGITVTGTPQQSLIISKAAELLQLGRDHGYERSELVEILRTIA
jgi:GntR family transcriptional regulator